MLQGQPEQQRRQIIESLSEKLESISASADELLARAKPKVTSPDAGRIKAIEPPKQRPQQIEPVAVRTESKPVESKAVAVARVEAKPVVAVQPQQPKAAAATDAKLAEYYGVSQANDAVAFVTLYPRAHPSDRRRLQRLAATKLPMEKVGESKRAKSHTP